VPKSNTMTMKLRAFLTSPLDGCELFIGKTDLALREILRCHVDKTIGGF